MKIKCWLWRGAGQVLVTVFLTVLTLSPVIAHEFWVAPEDYTPQRGGRVVAALQVGQMMAGADFPYLSNRFQSFTVTNRDGTYDVLGNEGDSPALSYVAETAGLHVIAYVARAEQLTFDAWEEFTEYLAYEGLDAITAMHQARGLPESGFTEAYTRHAKGLVQVGPAGPEDVDRPLGLRLELVAEANPYAEEAETLPVKLTWQDKPLAGAQIAVFRRASEVTRATLTTDAAGRAQIPLDGKGEYLLNAVHIEPVEDADAVWHSHWASLTFAREAD